MLMSGYVFQIQGYIKKGNIIKLVDNVEVAHNESDVIKKTKEMYSGFKLLRIKDITNEILEIYQNL